MKTSINNPFSGGLAGYNMAANNLQRNTIGDSINNLSQINARRGVQDLMNQGTAMTDPAMQSLAMGMSQPQQQALQQRSDAQATLDQRGIANTLAQDKFGYQQTNDANLAGAKVDAASALFGRQNEQEAIAQKNRLDVQDDQQNFQMHKVDVMNDNSLNLEQKKAKLKFITDNQSKMNELSTYKEKKLFDKSIKAPKINTIDESIRKDAGESLVKEINKPAKQVGKEFEDYQENENWFWDVGLGNEQTKTLSNWNKAFLSRSDVPADAKVAFNAMDPKQKMEILAAVNQKTVEEGGLTDFLKPKWAGGSDYLFKSIHPNK